jgi:transcription antitermination factor NusG
MRYYTSNVHASIVSQKNQYANFYTSSVFDHIADCLTTFFTYDRFDMDNALFQVRYMLNLDSPKYVKDVYTSALNFLVLIVEAENTLQAMSQVYNLIEWLNTSIADNELYISMAISMPTTRYEKLLRALLRVRYILSSLEWYQTGDTASLLHRQVLDRVTRQDVGIAIMRNLYNDYRYVELIDKEQAIAAIRSMPEYASVALLYKLSGVTPLDESILNATQYNLADIMLSIVTDLSSRIVAVEEDVKRRTEYLYMRFHTPDFTEVDAMKLQAKKLRSIVSALLSLETKEV